MLQTKLCVHWQLTLSPINKSAPLHPSHCPFIICQLSTGCQRTTSDIQPFKLSACVESLSPPLVQKQVRGEKVTVRLKKEIHSLIKNCLPKAHTYCRSAWIQTPSCLCKGAPAATWAVLTSSRDLSHSGRQTHPMCVCANKPDSKPQIPRSLCFYWPSFPPLWPQ